ncbi:MAG TPA: DUF11 domain-containing protein [Gaiellaceae bacterium]|nr:DUF11 domain-containing protein [Gaiellaceae bacterium]
MVTLVATGTALMLPGSASASTCSPAVTSSPSLCGTDFTAFAAEPFSGQVGTISGFSDFGDVCSDTITIDWGDGSAPTAAAISNCGPSQFIPLLNAGEVDGAHTYAAPGSYTVTLDDQTANVTATATATVGQRTADLATTLNAPTSARTGSQLIYAIQVGNAGPDPAHNVVMTDNLSYGTTYQAITASGWSCSTPTPGSRGGTVICRVDPLASGGQVSSSIGVKVVAKAGQGNLNDSASVSSGTFDPDTANNTASVSTQVTKK